MEKEEFLKKIMVELKISKNSEYTIRNYLSENIRLLDFTKKQPNEVDEDDVKIYIVENLSDHASMSIILFLSAIRYAYSNILKNDITLGIKRPKREKRLPTVLTKEEVKKMLNSVDTKKSKLMISLIYAGGMGVMMIGISIGLATSKEFVTDKLRRVMPHMHKISGLIIILAGIYIIYYELTIGLGLVGNI